MNTRARRNGLRSETPGVEVQILFGYLEAKTSRERVLDKESDGAHGSGRKGPTYIRFCLQSYSDYLHGRREKKIGDGVGKKCSTDTLLHTFAKMASNMRTLSSGLPFLQSRLVLPLYESPFPALITAPPNCKQ
jgi:hypothetical protein